MRVVPASRSTGLPAVLAALDAGSIVVVPTDTVYGLAARIDRPEALRAIFAVKGRPDGLALPVLVGRWGQVRAVASDWPRSASMLAARFWPGPLTVVVPARGDIGPSLGGDGRTVGVRRPAHRFVRALCARAGPLAVTSANRHGSPPCTTLDEVLATFGTDQPPAAGADEHGGAVTMAVDGGTCNGQPSTVVDCTGSSPTCLRQGAIPWAWVQAAVR
jgi:tRNA threonylcarbamoyl adenosine modification protein (Sua5/YciO/YrdC/YwlC family)